MEKEIKKLQEEIRVLRVEIKNLVEFADNSLQHQSDKRIHCRQCHSVNITLIQDYDTVNYDYCKYRFECKDCGFKEERIIYHRDII